jgi:hypothetical protein
MAHGIVPDGQLIDTFSWKADLAKAASATVYDSSTSGKLLQLPPGTPFYLKVQMTGGGGKLDSTNTVYPLMLVVSETPPISGTNGFKRFYPFPGTPAVSYTIAYIPLSAVSMSAGLAPKFTVSVVASSGGSDAHSSANGNQGELYGEIVTGATMEREMTTIHHGQVSATYDAANKICFNAAWRRASTGSFIVSTSGDTLGYRIKSFGHLAYGTASESVNNITSSTTASAATLGWAAAWGTSCVIEGFASGAAITSRNLLLVGTITGGQS